MQKLTLTNIIIGLFLLMFAYVLFTITQRVFSTSVLFFWILIGIILGFVYKSKLKKYIITYIVLTVIADILAAIISSNVTTSKQSYIILYLSIFISLTLLFFLTRKIYILSKQQNKFPIDTGILEKKLKFFLISMGTLLFLSLVSSAASINTLNKFHSEKLIHEQKKQDIDKNYLDVSTLIKKKNWQNALIKLNDVIEIDANYKDTQKYLKIIKTGIAELEKQKQIENAHRAKIESIKAPKVASIKKWFENKESIEKEKRRTMEESEPELLGKGQSDYYFWADNISWNKDLTIAKVVGVEKIYWPNGNVVETKTLYRFTFTASDFNVEFLGLIK